jgi:hypothetical protein
MPTFTIERELRKHFAANPDGIIAAYLFGSVARERRALGAMSTWLSSSRLRPPATLEGFAGRSREPDHATRRPPAQVIVLNTAPAGLIHRVLRDGVLVLDRAPSARIRFEVRARNEFSICSRFSARYRCRALAAP